MNPVFKSMVLKKYQAEYAVCHSCGYLCALNPVWLTESYETPIYDVDTGLLTRNIDLSRKISAVIYGLFPKDGLYLDYAGGYGVFSRLMRDAGFQFYHVDPYTKNLFARDIEWDGIMPMEAVTCFECFEHFADPCANIQKIAAISKTIIFSTTLLPATVPPLSWDYYGFSHGQHISFYSSKTLSYIAKQLGVSFMSVGNLHFFTPEALPRARVEKLVRSANRIAHPFSNKTNFELIARKMSKRKKICHDDSSICRF
jgi:hypothetical protein